MPNYKIAIKVLIFCFILLIIGILVIQSTGCFNSEFFNNKSSNSDYYKDYKNEYEINDESKKELNQENKNSDNSSKNAISNFIDKTKQRYPALTKIGKNMGIKKKNIIGLIEKIGCEKTIEAYISFFSSIFSF